jgi:acyl dehydratase
MNDHQCNTGAIGAWSEEIPFTVDGKRTVAYAEATGDRTAQHLDGTYAPPVFAVVPPFDLLAATTMAAVPDELMLKILHGEQDFRFHRPLRPGEEVVSRAKAIGIHGKSSGVVVTTLAETRTPGGELVNEQYFAGFFKGGRWSRADGEPAPAHAFDESLRSREPDAQVVHSFDPDQTHRYAEASGDPMPIHTDDEFARQMGLPGIIIHGLCTMAFTSHAVIGRACPDDPARLKRLAVRFSAPAFPRNTITTSLWHAGDGRWAFETETDEGKTVIKEGLAEVE